MPPLKVRVPATVVAPDFAAVRRELGVEEAFPAAALAEASEAAGRPQMPDADATAVPLFTVDPAGSRDLDQAMALERRGDGYRVTYAIADVGAFVAPGGALDAETHRRGETLYTPDERVPLHPDVIGEGAGSLLPGQERPAVLWVLDLDASGELTATDVRRARVRSQRQLDYPGVQAALDAGTADEALVLLREVGQRREELARTRDAVDLPTPEQVVVDGPDGRPHLSYRAPLPAEGWNAQISLLTGMAAAGLMLRGGIGLLRTLPPPDPGAVASLRRSALGLGVDWPEGARYGDVVSALDPTVPTHAALLTLATRLLRGAGYTAFDGQPPAEATHSAVAAPYAHCTAPLRRLADRYVGEVCLALAAGREVPDWCRAALPALPEEMATADHRAHALERAIVDLAETLVLAPCTGELFDAVVVEVDRHGGIVQLTEPAVRARCEGTDLVLGARLRVRLERVDEATRQVMFRPA